MLTALSEPYRPSSSLFDILSQPQFPNLKYNVPAVEHARMSFRLQKKPLKASQMTTQYPTNSQFPSATLPTLPAKSSANDIFEWNLQSICGPGPAHREFIAQQPHIKYKLFTIIREQKWQPSITVLKESIMGPEDTSLHWPNFLCFRVLQDTIPFHNWKILYQAQRNGKRPMM